MKDLSTRELEIIVNERVELVSRYMHSSGFDCEAGVDRDNFYTAIQKLNDCVSEIRTRLLHDGQ